MPDPRMRTTSEVCSVLWMSPDEVLLLCPFAAAPDLADRIAAGAGDAHVTAVVVSDARVAFRLAGPGAETALASLTPADLARRAAELGMGAVALTDTTNLYGAVQHYKACKAAGIKAILGAELTVQPQGLHHPDPRNEEGGYHLVALAR